MKQLSVEIIHKCPNFCVHCSSLSSINCTSSIPTEVVLNIIDGMEKIGMEVLNISGGEPFLHEGLLEIVRYAKKKKIAVYIYTSGIILNGIEEACAIDTGTIRKLKEFNLDKVIFDLPAIDEEVYDKFMGTKGYLQYVLNSINVCISEDVFSEIHFVPTKINIDQIDKVMSFAERVGVKQVSFLGLVPHGRARQNKEELYLPKRINDQLKQKLDQMKSAHVRIGIPLQVDNNEYKCYAGRQKLCVRYDGKVFGCEAFKYIKLYDAQGKAVIPDSVFERNIEAIYYDSQYLNQEREFIARQMSCSECNEKCPVQRMMRICNCVE